MRHLIAVSATLLALFSSTRLTAQLRFDTLWSSRDIELCDVSHDARFALAATGTVISVHNASDLRQLSARQFRAKGFPGRSRFADGNRLVITPLDSGSIAAWDWRLSKLAYTISIPLPSGVSRRMPVIALSPDRTKVFAVVVGGKSTVFRTTDGAVVSSNLPVFSSASTAAVNNEATMCAISTAGQPTRIFDLASGAQIETISGLSLAIGLAPDNDTLLVVQRTSSGSCKQFARIDKYRLAARTLHQGLAGLLVDSCTPNPNSFVPVYSQDGRLFSAGNPGWVFGMDGRRRYIASGRVCGFVEDSTKVLVQTNTRIAKESVDEDSVLVQVPGHSDKTVYVGFNPSSSDVITGGHDGSVKAWNTPSGALRHTFNNNGQPSSLVVVSPDGRLIATSGHQHSIFVYDYFSGQLVRTLVGPYSKCVGLALTGSPAKLIALFETGELLEWDPLTGTSQVVWRHPNPALPTIAFSPNGRFIAAYDSNSRNATLYDRTTGSSTVIAVASATLAFSTNSDWLAIVESQSLASVRTVTGQIHQRIPLFARPNAIAISSCGSLVAFDHFRAERRIDVWNLAAGEPIGSKRPRGGSIVSMAFSADDDWLALGNGDELGAEVWRSNFELDPPIPLFEPWELGGIVGVDGKGTRVVTSRYSNWIHSDYLITVRDALTGNAIADIPAVVDRYSGAGLSYSGRLAYVATAERFSIFKLDDMRTIYNSPFPAEAVGFIGDEQLLFRTRNQLNWLDIASGAVIRTLPADSVTVVGSHLNRRIATSHGNLMTIRDAEGRALISFPFVEEFAISANDDYVAMAAYYNAQTVRVLSLRTGAQVLYLSSAPNLITDIALCSNMDRLTVARSWPDSPTYTYREIWDVSTGRLIGTTPEHPFNVRTHVAWWIDDLLFIGRRDDPMSGVLRVQMP